MRALLLAAGILAGSPAGALAADAVSPASWPSGFGGIYAAIGGGFGLGTIRDFSVGWLEAEASPKGAFGAGAVGYNMQSGSLLFGLELSGRAGGESLTAARTRPVESYWFFFSLPSTGTATDSYAFRSDAGLHLSTRVGFVMQDTLLFAKIGLGAARTTDSFRIDGSGTIMSCAFFWPCDITPVPSGAITMRRWTPSFLFGAGVEQNFGRWFLRIGGEVEAISGLQGNKASGELGPRGGFSGAAHSDFYWATRASGLVGARF